MRSSFHCYLWKSQPNDKLGEVALAQDGVGHKWWFIISVSFSTMEANPLDQMTDWQGVLFYFRCNCSSIALKVTHWICPFSFQLLLSFSSQHLSLNYSLSSLCLVHYTNSVALLSNLLHNFEFMYTVVGNCADSPKAPCCKKVSWRTL